MGNICCKKRRIRKKIVLLLLGLDNAGKTRAANGLAGDPLSTPVPTVGFSVINLKYYGYNVKIFDLGGGSSIRDIWPRYYVDAHGIIFVVDSSDFSRFNEAKMVLEDILNNDKISGKPLLILANKQDNENALDEIDVIEYLNIEHLVNKQKCPTLVQSCSASETNSKLDPGIQKGYEWLLSNVARSYDNLNLRVEADSKEQERKDRELMMERMRRIKKIKEEERKKKSEDQIETYSDYVKKITLAAESNKQILEGTAFDSLEIHSDDSSGNSSLSFPPLHVDAACALPERPKSAVQIVKHQLQLNSSSSRRPPSRTRANKTAPMNLYGNNDRLPRSAQGGRPTDFPAEVRHLRSADDRWFAKTAAGGGVTGMGPSGDSHHPASDVFQLRTASAKLPPLHLRSVAAAWVHGGPANGDVISVVDVD